MNYLVWPWFWSKNISESSEIEIYNIFPNEYSFNVILIVYIIIYDAVTPLFHFLKFQVKPRISNHTKSFQIDTRSADEITDDDLALVADSVSDKRYDSIYVSL